MQELKCEEGGGLPSGKPLWAFTPSSQKHSVLLIQLTSPHLTDGNDGLMSWYESTDVMEAKHCSLEHFYVPYGASLDSKTHPGQSVQQSQGECISRSTYCCRNVLYEVWMYCRASGNGGIMAKLPLLIKHYWLLHNEDGRHKQCYTRKRQQQTQSGTDPAFRFKTRTEPQNFTSSTLFIYMELYTHDVNPTLSQLAWAIPNKDCDSYGMYELCCQVWHDQIQCCKIYCATRNKISF